MLLFVVYAMLVWYGSLRGRRRLSGYAVLIGGVLFLLLVNRLHLEVAKMYNFVEYVAVLRVLLYPYIALVGGIGFFLVRLPIDLPRGELHCKVCRYDLSDLKDEVFGGGPCPECGATIEEAKSRAGRRLARKRLQKRNREEPNEMPGLSLGIAGSTADEPDYSARDEYQEG
ncbi:MAG: hypothetical protein COB69_01095 [Phycisphaera sp.]|nr:MAG: hypothetical protein COB69_01095 [Phycisphaera sp.]